MRLLRRNPVGGCGGRARPLRCRRLSLSPYLGSRKRLQVRRRHWSPRRYLLLGCVRPRPKLRLQRWRIARPALRRRRVRRMRLSLKNRKPRLRLRLKRSLLRRRPSRRRKLRLLPHKHSLLCRRKWKLLLPLLEHSPPKISHRLQRLQPSQRHSPRFPKRLHLPRQRRHPFNTSSWLSSAKAGRRCRRLT